MRALTTTLLAAQRAGSGQPAVKVEIRNNPLGAVSLVWERLYSGSETDGPHGVTIAGDGSLIRARVTAPGDNRKLYRQRVINPGSGSDYSTWTDHNTQFNVTACAICSLGAEVSLVWIKSSGEINRSRSTDNGANWQAVDYPGYAPTGAVAQLAAAYKPNGDLFLFFTDGNTLYLIRRTGGSWQARQQWNKTTGALSGAAVFYDGDWRLLAAGRDSSGHYRLWSLVYGDGGEAPAGAWSALKTVMTAPADSGYEFGPVHLGKPDIMRLFCNEKYSGEEAYNRPLRAHAVPGTAYLDNLWTEPKPFDFLNSGGLALAHNTDYAWLSCGSGVWRAALAAQVNDLSGDVLSIQGEMGGAGGRVSVELNNDLGQYANPGQGDLAPLISGGRVDISPGYRTTAGVEYSAGLSFILRGWEHVRGGGKAGLDLAATDGWDELRGWKARTPLRWNAAGDEASVKDILAWVLARAGLRLEVKSQSAVITGYYPDFTIQAGDNGAGTVSKLLSCVPDRIYLEGGTAWLVHPLPGDAAVYGYGSAHLIYEGRYGRQGWTVNRVQVEGWDPNNLRTVTADVSAWAELNRQGERLKFTEDRNLKTAARARERGETILRKAGMAALTGKIRAPVNCGAQLLDVIEVTDNLAGLTSARRRVIGITLNYRPRKGEYENEIYLGDV